MLRKKLNYEDLVFKKTPSKAVRIHWIRVSKLFYTPPTNKWGQIYRKAARIFYLVVAKLK